jgi:transcription antitermination factor NusG
MAQFQKRHDPLTEHLERVQNEAVQNANFKKGDRVKVLESTSDHKGQVGTVVSMGGVCDVKFKDGETRSYFPDKLEKSMQNEEETEKNSLKLKVGDKVKQLPSEYDRHPSGTGKIVEISGGFYNVDWGSGVYTDEQDDTVKKV